MAIYEVEMSQVIIVEAEEEFMAHDVVRDSIYELDWQQMNLDHPCEVRSLKGLKDGWDGECIPYGGDGNTRLKDILPESR